MNRGFYTKMAWGNIRKQRQIYVPYLLAVSLVMGLYYILNSLRIMVGESSMKGTRTMMTILGVCVPIAGIFALVILFYVNSFVMKQRKKEFSLYNILGMEKRHLTRLMVTEVFYIALASVFLGVAGGALFSQLAFLVYFQMIHMPVALTFSIPLSAVKNTVLLFGAGFLLVAVYDVISVVKTNPLQMLQESRQGEREPRARWLLAAVGLGTLAAGYALAQMASNPLKAMARFFSAALLVTMGTYCLFIAGSIALLKFLKKREKFFYKPQNFISVSGMMYRMKQNAVGLASICILSTTVMATVGSCLSIFAGIKDSIGEDYIRMVKVSSLITPGEDFIPREMIREDSERRAEEFDFTVENEISYTSFRQVFCKDGEALEAMWGDYELHADYSDLVQMEFLLQEDYEALTGKDLKLEKGQAAVYESQEHLVGEKLEILGLSFDTVQRVSAMEVSREMGLDIIKNYVQVILPDFESLEEIALNYDKAYQEAYPDSGAEHILVFRYFFDVSGDGERLEEFYDYQHMREAYYDVPRLYEVNNRMSIEEEYFQDYGTILFVGLFLAVMFLVATVLIIYYKQITEGYDDRQRFQIMQKVGLSAQEVKKTIHRQVLQVFFLPLAAAVLHIAAAFRSIVSMMSLFGVSNTPLFAGCICGTVAVFGFIYFLVYQATARAYYRIISCQ